MTKTYKSQEIFSRLVEIRRSIHKHPELAFEEIKTAETIIAELDRLGIPYEYGGKGTGVVGRLITDESAPIVGSSDQCVLPYRSDMTLVDGKIKAVFSLVPGFSAR